MAGPTTEVLNEDIKEVKEDLHEIRVDVDVVKAGLSRVTEDIKELKVDIRDISGDLAVVKVDLHNVATGLAEFKGEVRVTMGLAKWAAAFLITIILTSGGAGIWWASSLTSNVRTLEKRFDPFESRIDKVESRFDKFEAQLTKLVDQTRPASPIPKAEGSTHSLLKSSSGRARPAVSKSVSVVRQEIPEVVNFDHPRCEAAEGSGPALFLILK